MSAFRRPLNARQRRFADSWAGFGSGVEAARAAGYGGGPHALAAAAARALRHPGIRARIEARYGRPLSELQRPTETHLAPLPPEIEAQLELGELDDLGCEDDDLSDLDAVQLELLKDPPPGHGLTKGRGRGTQTERIELTMALARHPRTKPIDKLRALKLAAELEGEIGRRRPMPAPVPVEPVAPPAPHRLRLVLNENDKALTRGEDS